ncbi:MAG: hypothetical protein ACLGG7_05525 [Bacteriovoracia bacterium]
MIPIQNLDPQLIAAKSAGKTAPQGANKLVGEAPVMEGDFASLLMQEVSATPASAPAILAEQQLVSIEGEPVLNPDMLETVVAEDGTQVASLGVQMPAPAAAPTVKVPQDANLAAPLSTEPTPKLIDPALIKQVNEVVIPQGQGIEQVQAQPVESTPTTLKDLLLQQQQQPATSGKLAGRSPAIDFAKSEVDPQLMGFEDFVAQKNAVTGKTIAPNAYGMPIKNTLSAPLSTPKAEVAEKLLALESAPAPTQLSMPQNAQTVFGVEAPLATAASANEAAPQKVFDLQNLSQAKNSNIETVISQVSDYIIQAKASKEPSVNMKVQHQDLGLLDITVNRGLNDAVTIAIGTQDLGAKTFLGQHREQLLTHLAQSGVTVADLKMEQSSGSQKDMNQPGQQNFAGQDRQFGSEQNQRREEQQRRHDLWELMREKEVA